MSKNVGLNPDYTQQMVGKLNAYLSNVQVSYMNVRGFHWNIVGKQFFGLHAKFEEVYDELNEMADEIAERILMLGGKPVHAFSEYLKTATIKEKVNVSSTEATVAGLLDDVRALLANEREILSTASDNDDEGTSNLVSDYISKQEKLIWMLESFLK